MFFNPTVWRRGVHVQKRIKVEFVFTQPSPSARTGRLHTKTIRWFSAELVERMGTRPRENPLNSGAHPWNPPCPGLDPAGALRFEAGASHSISPGETHPSVRGPLFSLGEIFTSPPQHHINLCFYCLLNRRPDGQGWNLSANSRCLSSGVYRLNW